MDGNPDARRPSRCSLMPQTQLGRRAALLLAAGVALIALTTLLASVSELDGSPWLALMTLPAMAAILCGALAAAVAIVRRHERGGVALLPVLFGLALAALLIGELVAPHD